MIGDNIEMIAMGNLRVDGEPSLERPACRSGI